MLTVVVITRNEEDNLPELFKSLSFLKIPYEVVIFDSFSTDRTIETARRFGARVFAGRWKGYSYQRKRALRVVKTPWVMFLDADERLTKEVAQEISENLKTERYEGFIVKRVNFYMDKMQKMRATKLLRIARTDKVEIPDVPVHEKMLVKGRVKLLKYPIVHYPYRNLLHQWEKNTNYANLFASEVAKTGVLNIALKFPMSFLKYYILNLALLDGVEGIIYSLSQSWYHLQKYMLIYERQKKR